MDNVDKDENSHESMDTGIQTNRQEYETMTSTFHIGVAQMTPEEQEARAQE